MCSLRLLGFPNVYWETMSSGVIPTVYDCRKRFKSREGMCFKTDSRQFEAVKHGSGGKCLCGKYEVARIGVLPSLRHPFL